MTEPLPIIIDTDPGQDDAVAILLALASPEFEVLGITAVAGNVPLALTEINARKICELAGRPETKVFAGCSAALVASAGDGGICTWANGTRWPCLARAQDAFAKTIRGRFHH